MKMFKWYISAFLIGVLVTLLGFPIMVDGHWSWKSVIIMIIFDILFGMVYFKDNKS